MSDYQYDEAVAAGGQSYDVQRSGLTARLAEALDSNDWRLAISVLEHDWSYFVLWDRPLLDRAFREIPRPLIDSSAVVVAVKEIFLRVSGDLGEADLLPLDDILNQGAIGLEQLVASRPGRYALSATAAFMIAYRAHGRYGEAARFSRLCEEAARIALRHDPDQAPERVPSAYMQIGLTRLQADDPIGAYLAMREAFDTRQRSNDPTISHDAAGNISLLLAVEGEIERSRTWLARYRERPLPADPLDGIAAAAALAEVLVAIETELDTSGSIAADVFDSLRVNALGWADALTYVRATWALQSGDPHHAMYTLDLDSRRTRRHLVSPFYQSRIDACAGDVHMALGHGTLAHRSLARARRSSPVMASRARLHLLANENQQAIAVANSVISHSASSTRARLDSFLSAAIGSRRLGDHSGATELARRSLLALERCGAFSVAVLHPRQELIGTLKQIPDSETRSKLLEYLKASRLEQPDEVEVVKLTAAEQRVLELLAEGHSRSRIADLLFVSPNTVKTQLRTLYVKLQADSSESALHRARLLGFLPALNIE